MAIYLPACRWKLLKRFFCKVSCLRYCRCRHPLAKHYHASIFRTRNRINQVSQKNIKNTSFICAYTGLRQCVLTATLYTAALCNAAVLNSFTSSCLESLLSGWAGSTTLQQQQTTNLLWPFYHNTSSFLLGGLEQEMIGHRHPNTATGQHSPLTTNRRGFLLTFTPVFLILAINLHRYTAVGPIGVILIRSTCPNHRNQLYFITKLTGSGPNNSLVSAFLFLSFN